MEHENAPRRSEHVRVRVAEHVDVEMIGLIDSRSRIEAWTEQAYREVLTTNARECWVAERAVDGQVVGFLVATTVTDQAEVDTICVCPESRRDGVASLLLNHLHRALVARSVKSVFLEVRASNRAANSLYAGLGYENVGVRRSYYRDGEDALCLRLDIDDSSTYSA